MQSFDSSTHSPDPGAHDLPTGHATPGLSTTPSQSSSRPLQISCAPGWIEGSLSSQSGSTSSLFSFILPQTGYPSPSRSLLSSILPLQSLSNPSQRSSVSHATQPAPLQYWPGGQVPG